MGENWNLLSSRIPMRCSQWLHSWWKHYSSDSELYVLKVTASNGAIVGIAPWCIRRSGAQRAVMALGSGEVCSDHLTVLTTAEYESAVTNALAEWLLQAANSEGCDQWDRFELECVPDDESTVLKLVRRMSQLGCSVHCRPDLGLWQLDLPPTWDEFVSRFPKRRRKRFRQYERAIGENDLSLRIARGGRELNEGVETLIDLHMRRRRSKNENSCFESEPYLEFIRESAPLLHRAGMAQLAVLDQCSSPIAVEFSLLNEESIYLYQSGFDPAASELSPGHLITVLLIQQAIAAGRRRFEFLRGDEGYKAFWGARPTESIAIRVAANRLGPQLRHNVWLVGHSLKEVVKSGLATPLGR